jgi:hypothetical protein
MVERCLRRATGLVLSFDCSPTLAGVEQKQGLSVNRLSHKPAI